MLNDFKLSSTNKNSIDMKKNSKTLTKNQVKAFLVKILKFSNLNVSLNEN